MRLAVLIFALAAPAVAQDARLVLREAFIEGRYAPTDTSAMEWQPLPRQDSLRVYLGAVLLELEPGSVTRVEAAYDQFARESHVVSVEMVPRTAAAFTTLKRTGSTLAVAIVLDGRVLAVPIISNVNQNVNMGVAGRWMRITDDLSPAEAQALAHDIEEATGATRTLAEAFRMLRASVDLSSPERAAAAAVRAFDLQDWQTAARVIHPDIATTIRDSAERVLTIEQDSARSMYGSKRTVALHDILEAPLQGSDWSVFSDEHVLALVLATTWTPRPFGDGAHVVAIARIGAETAYVVFEGGNFGDVYTSLYTLSYDRSSMVAFEFSRVGEDWRMRYPTF